MFWEFDSEGTIPQHAEYQQSPSKSGDACHYLISKLSRSEAKQIAYSIPIASVRTCENGRMRAAELNDFVDDLQSDPP